MKHHRSTNTYGPTMQCNSKTLDYVIWSKCPRLSITHGLSLNHRRSIAWLMIVYLSIRRCLSLSVVYLASDVDRLTSVITARKPRRDMQEKINIVRKKICRAHDKVSPGHENVSRIHERLSHAHEIVTRAHEIKMFTYMSYLGFRV